MSSYGERLTARDLATLAASWIPAELAHKGRPGPQGTLIYDVELLQIVK